MLSIEGDLLELFAETLQQKGPAPARRQFAWEVVKLFRPSLFRNFMKLPQWNLLALLRMQVVLSLRSYGRYRSTFLVNLLGLSLGLTSALLIFSWVQAEHAVDAYHAQDAQLYQVMNNSQRPEEVVTSSNTPALLSEALRSQIPGVAHAVTVGNAEFSPRTILSSPTRDLEAKGTYAGAAFFQVFSFPFLAGNPASALEELNALAISERLAIRLFGSAEDALGQTVSGGRQLFRESFLVAGVYENPPATSTLQFDFVANYALVSKKIEWVNDWNGDAAQTFLVLREDAPLLETQRQIQSLLQENGDRPNSTLFLQRFSDRYLHGEYQAGVPNGGRITQVSIFSGVAWCLLLLAAINFINLSTAQASRKLKEVGVKKVFGIRRRIMAFQFLVESQLLALIALLVAWLLTVLLLPSLNALTDKAITWSWDMTFILPGLGLALLLGTLAGIYPALYLSGFHPLLALKGKLQTTAWGELWVRKGLVVFQFALSFLFILGFLVIHNQLKLVQQQSLGYDQDQLIHFRVSGAFDRQVLLAELRNISGVQAATNTFGGSIVSLGGSGSGFWWDDEESQERLTFRRPAVGYEFTETLGIELLEGRTFSGDFAQEENKLLVNEAAADLIGREGIVGRLIHDSDEEKEIIGVVKNFHLQSLHDPIQPTIMRFSERGSDFLVRLQAGTDPVTLQQIEAAYLARKPEFPFSFSYVNDEYQALYTAEERMSTLAKAFTLAAYLICGLGLLGLTAFSVERRRKEVGIRRVLGATIRGLTFQLSWDFLRLILLGIVLATPVAWLLLNQWLQGFAYRVSLHPGWFVLAALASLGLGLLVVGTRTLRAVLINPVHSLRNE